MINEYPAKSFISDFSNPDMHANKNYILFILMMVDKPSIRSLSTNLNNVILYFLSYFGPKNKKGWPISQVG